MIKKHYFYTLALLIFFACNENSNIGEGLLNDEKLDLDFTNNFEIKAATFINDPSIAYFRNVDELSQVRIVTPGTGIIGKIDDPFFGKLTSSLYANIVYNSTAPSFTDFIVDSAVMTFTYDTLGFTGKINQLHHIKIEEIDEDYYTLDTIYNNKKLAVKSTLIGEKLFTPSLKDSISIINYVDSVKTKLPPQLRIKVSTDWANNLINNPEIKDGLSPSNEKLYKALKGIKVSCEVSGSATIGLNLNDSNLSNSGNTKLTLFMRKNTSKTTYSFLISTKKFNSFEQVTENSPLAASIDNTAKGDSLLYLRSMGGPSFYLELPELNILKDKIINFAEVELTLAGLSGDDTTLKPFTQLIANKKVNGNYVPIQDAGDLIFREQQPLSLLLGFNGRLETKNSISTYKLNITKHLKSLLKDPTLDRKIYVQAYNANDKVGRSIIYGPKNSKGPVKLKITYTNK